MCTLTQDMETATDKPDKDDTYIYESVLDEYRMVIEHDFYKNAPEAVIPYHSSSADSDSYRNINLISGGRYYSDSYAVYYAMEDVDGDGSCELYIG